MARGDDESLSEFKAKIEAEVNAIKQKYETKIQGLENRVETLENENSRLKHQKSSAVTSAQSPEVAALKQRVTKLEQTKTETAIGAGPNENAQPPAPDAIRKIQTRLQESQTETQYVNPQDGWLFKPADFYKLPRPFEFHGYLRSGFGLNGEEGKMEAFKAPGAGAKYRLGNEAETYGELSLPNGSGRMTLRRRPM